MREEERRLRVLPARALDELIEDLAVLQARELKGEPARVPRVTVHLHSGRELSGMVLQFVQGRHGASVLLRTGAQTRHDAGSDATYVPLSHIEALTVHDAAGYAESLSREGVSPYAEPAPTRLAARRAVDAHHKELVALLQGELEWSATIDGTPDGEPLRMLVQLSADTASALKAAGNDEMGRSAILAGIKRVVIEGGTETGVKLDHETLRVNAPLHKGSNARLSVPELRAAIEKLI